MANVVKIVAVYMDYDHYVKPKEVNKIFRLYDKWQDNKDEDAKEELVLLLKVLTATEDRTYKLGQWKNGGKNVTVLQILEPVVSSLFDKPQEI